jgi:hypothetical protein
MESDRSPLAQSAEATLVWLSLVAFFILWPIPSSPSGLAVELVAGLALIVAVSVASALAFEHRMPALRMGPGPTSSHERVALMSLGGIVFVVLLAAVLITGSWPRWMWVAYLGMGYAMTIAGINRRRWSSGPSGHGNPQ